MFPFVFWPWMFYLGMLCYKRPKVLHVEDNVVWVNFDRGRS